MVERSYATTPTLAFVTACKQHPKQADFEGGQGPNRGPNLHATRTNSTQLSVHRQATTPHATDIHE